MTRRSRRSPSLRTDLHPQQLQGFHRRPRHSSATTMRRKPSRSCAVRMAGIYAWRADPRTCPPEFRQKTAASQAALIRETDFAFKQAFAFCPYSPEAVFRYINFLLLQGRFDDAILICETCIKLDPVQRAGGEHGRTAQIIPRPKRPAHARRSGNWTRWKIWRARTRKTYRTW